MKILLEQSRFQNIFNRLYLGVHQHFWAFLPIILIPMFLGSEVDWEYIWLILFWGILALGTISLWLYVFNRGDYTITEYGLEMTNEKITYIRYGSRNTIEWSDFDGFEVKNKWPRMIILKSKTRKDIEFSYYTFSGEQRRTLFDALSRMHS